MNDLRGEPEKIFATNEEFAR